MTKVTQNRTKSASSTDINSFTPIDKDWIFLRRCLINSFSSLVTVPNSFKSDQKCGKHRQNLIYDFKESVSFTVTIFRKLTTNKLYYVEVFTEFYTGLSTNTESKSRRSITPLSIVPLSTKLFSRNSGLFDNSS